MMRKMQLLVLLVFVTLKAGAQNNFVLLDVTENSDFNYKAIENMDSVSKMGLINSVFKPISGQYKVYRFIEDYLGESPKFLPDSSVIVTLQDILLIKVDKNKKIIDAYQYSLQYAEYPAICDLYKLVGGKKIKLDSKLNLSSLKFRLIGDVEYCGRDPFMYLSQSHIISKD